MVSLGGRGQYYLVDEGSSPRPVSTLLKSWENGEKKEEQEQEQEQEQEKEEIQQEPMQLEQMSDTTTEKATGESSINEERLLGESSASALKTSLDKEERTE